MRNSPLRAFLDSGEIQRVLNDVLWLFSETERVIASHETTADYLQHCIMNLGKIRTLLHELARYGGGDAEDPGVTVNTRYLVKRCLDLEGRVKELRNDLLGR